MGIEIASAFERKSTVPIDETAFVADLTARDAIDVGIRYDGFVVYVESEGKNYQLVGGITNGDWAEFGSGGGSGGGGGSLDWVEDENSPLPTTEFQQNVYNYPAADTQKLFSMVKVPSGYTAGNPIVLKIPFFSPDNSGTGLLQAVATLIRPGTTALDSTTNQRTTTNTAVTLSAGTVNIPQSVDLDITSSIGEINSVAVLPGDLIKVQLQRGTDTATSDLRAMVYAAETTFV